MKKLITIAALFAIVAAGAQQQTITYSMKMENNPAAAMMGDVTITLYAKNGKSLTDMHSQMASSQTLVTDSGSLTLMTAMGQKFYMKAPGLPNGTAGIKTPDIRYTNETKQIAGYTCTKAYLVVKKDGGADTAVFWFTDKLPLVAFGKESDLYKGLKGMPLEYTVNTPDVKLTVTALNVSTAPIADSVFAISTQGYTKLDPAMLKQFQQ